MRYTTVIDISDIESVYKNANCRLIYLHMALKCGYHDSDRDQLHMSLRALASSTGLTLSATRYAVKLLMNAKLLTRSGEIWRVLKWVQPETITARPKTKAQAAEQKAAGEIIDRQRQDDQERLEKERKAAQAEEEFRHRDTDYHRRFVEEYEALDAVPSAQRTVQTNVKLGRNRRWYVISREVLKQREKEAELKTE